MGKRGRVRRSPISALGEQVIALLILIGDFMEFVGQMFLWMLTRRPYRGTLVPAMYQIGVQSVPVVAITGVFLGMVLAVQAFAQFKSLHLESHMGAVINASLVTELGPVLAATMLAGRVGSAMAAEIATMKVTEQVDALRCLGTDPIHYLVVPRFLACVLLIPLLTVMADNMGVMGGALVSIKIKQVPDFYYWQNSRASVGLFNLFSGIGKSVFFGAEIAMVSCYTGFRSGAGAEGVGRAATLAFVMSFIAILVSDFFLGVSLGALYDWAWPRHGMRF